MPNRGLKTSSAIGGGIIALCVAFTSPQEGLRTTAYHDLARPEIATICYGETEGVHFGETKTVEQCKAMLAKSMVKYLRAVDTKLPGLPDNRRVAYADFAYNAGIARFNNSSMVRYELMGDAGAACISLNHYVYANKRVLKALVRRRNMEAELCLKNISSIDLKK